MCGIVGLLNIDRRPLSGSLVTRMVEVMAHRGPDDEGLVFIDTKTGDATITGGGATPTEVYLADLPYTPKKRWTGRIPERHDLALASRRLAIFDLSPAGHQPMSNTDGTLWVAYNGAIYNHKELREELRGTGHAFVSDSDTEVIIKAYEEWDVGCLHRFNGMWAFCIWDARRQRIFCARDRFGIKPFYYFLDGRTFAFASELKPLLHLGIGQKPNDDLIYDFLKFGILDHTDETFFDSIVKLAPSRYLVIDLEGRSQIWKYWDLKVSDEMESQHSDDGYAEQCRELFVDAVRLRLRSDVPVGSCLSGGLDSSSVVCVANGFLDRSEGTRVEERQKTFSACYDDSRFDERRYVEEIIRSTRAEKNYVFPSADEFLEELDRLIWHQEEPFGGTSIYAQWVVMKKARERGITVMLDGQGGDEQLGGYRKFYIFLLLKLLRSRRPGKLFWESLHLFSSPEILRTLNPSLGLRYFSFGDRLLGIDNLFREAFRQAFKDRQIDFGYARNLGQRIKADLFEFSLPVLLRYEDRNSMAHAIETRLPFLDYRLVERLASFPLTQKMRKGWTKYVMRNAMRPFVPEKVLYRKSKLGFDTPEDQWFRNRLYPMVKDVIQHSDFIPRYADPRKLLHHFDRYSLGASLYKSRFFFRFFIMELWARRFVSSMQESRV